MKINKGWIPVFLAPAVVLFLLIYAVPLGMVFVTSLFDYRLTGPGMTFIGFGNYIRLFQDPDFAQAIPLCGSSSTASYMWRSAR